jgi:hypothetical protein
LDHVRGHDQGAAAAFAYAMSLGEILAVNRRFACLLEAYRLGREDFPYFARSSRYR